MDNKDRFNKYIEDLNNYFNKNEDVTLYELGHSTKRIRNTIEYPNKFKNTILNNLEKVYVGILIALIVLLGFLNIGGFGLYFFGFVFFISGIFIGLYVKYFGLIFLVSHGLTGYYLMSNAIIGNTMDTQESINIISSIFNSPILKDNPGFLKVYLIGIVVVVVLAILSVVAYNVISILKNRKYFIVVPFALFFIALVMMYYINPLFHVL